MNTWGCLVQSWVLFNKNEFLPNDMERTWHLEMEEIDSEPIYEDEEKEIYLLDWDYSDEYWVVRHPIYAIWEALE